MTERSGSPALIIFIKNPEKGKVKTRLAASLGDDEALRIYLELLRHTRQVAQKVSADRYLFYSSFLEKNDDWSEKEFIKKVQSGADLGEKMTRAFEQVFPSNHPVLIIGSDCAELSEAVIHQAFEELQNRDFVIGPALDGGYYLLGMRQFEPGVFQNMEWSHADVCRDTQGKIAELGKTFFLLPALSDIDTAEDWEKFGWKI